MNAEETEQHYINIRWKTITESNMTGFYLLRNNINDISGAYTISTLITATNTNQPHEYSYLDTEVAVGSQYYWLKAVEADTIDTYYGPVVGVVTVTPGTPNDWGIYVSPNPVSSGCTIGYDVHEDCLVRICVNSQFDPTSIILYEGLRSSGRYWLNWNGQGLDEALVSNGYYVIQAQFKIENSVFEYWRSASLFINNQQLNNKPYTKSTNFGYSIPIRKYLHPGDTFPTYDLSGNPLSTLQVSGNYTIHVTKAGYQTATRSLSIPNSRKDITANFVLYPMVKTNK
jgi:hypothetical protein